MYVNVAKLALAALISSTMLSGCVGGTTYGTGVSQEKQTIEDLANILTVQKKRNNIDYAARPDLIVPENKNLVEPVETASTSNQADWPESPEARIARVRAEAEEAQATTASQNKFALSEKNFRATDPVLKRQEAPIGKGVPNVSCDPDGVIMRRCTGSEISNAVRAERKLESTAGSATARRYLTDPPLEYRTAASTAPVGDEGYSEAEKKRIEDERKALDRERVQRAR